MTLPQILSGLGVLMVVAGAWRVRVRRARRAADVLARVRALSLAGRVAVTAGVIVAVQWFVITHPANPWVLLAVLGLPALFASYALTRALTVTTVDAPHRRGGRR
jgi:hypothetical protein